jgi:hypothetical protein
VTTRPRVGEAAAYLRRHGHTVFLPTGTRVNFAMDGVVYGRTFQKVKTGMTLRDYVRQVERDGWHGMLIRTDSVDAENFLVIQRLEDWTAGWNLPSRIGENR